jgi:prevent-host-death family protein
MSQTVNVYEAKTNLSKLIAQVEAGEEITLSRNGRPVAKIVPLSWSALARTPGGWEGRVVIHDGFYEYTEQDDRDWYGE